MHLLRLPPRVRRARRDSRASRSVYRGTHWALGHLRCILSDSCGSGGRIFGHTCTQKGQSYPASAQYYYMETAKAPRCGKLVSAVRRPSSGPPRAWRGPSAPPGRSRKAIRLSLLSAAAFSMAMLRLCALKSCRKKARARPETTRSLSAPRRACVAGPHCYCVVGAIYYLNLSLYGTMRHTSAISNIILFE